jgi:NhaP-type Na+/H+ or K+/H+ antiporter
MNFALWLVIGGALLVFITLGGSLLSRLPLSPSMLYLGVGVLLSPWGLGLAAPYFASAAPFLEHFTEVIVLLSLFTSGLKLSAGLQDRRWSPSLRLALTSMLATVALITAVGVWLLGLPLGAAVLLGGILAPTDPVLATEVQVADPADGDRLRFALTGEGGLNDGTAFPVVLLGLGLLGLHDLGPYGLHWLALEVVWACLGGVAIGAALGAGVGRLVPYLRRAHQEAVGHDQFLAIGLIGLAYGAAELLQGNGFLAVFAAGLALRHTEQRATGAATAKAEAAAAGADPPAATTVLLSSHGVAVLAGADTGPAALGSLATHPQHASAFMAHAVLSFNEQLDRMGEVVGVLALGMLLWGLPWQAASWWFVPIVLLLVRPIAVAIGLAGSSTSPLQRRLIGWFGIRGIGSLFYLTYALNHGVAPDLGRRLAALTLSVVVTSIIVHGISVTPLMTRYGRRVPPA